MRQSAPEKYRVVLMDIERINQIGNTLADLAARTEALRGYL
jgi:predicted ATPase with chaperone activity